LFKWLDRDDIPSNIKAFIDEKDPDILCIQEYSNSAHLDLKVYPHRYIFIDGNQIKTGQAIFSKFPIINEGNIIFPKSDNNVIYADIKRGKDVIRVYNMHLQSIKISPDVDKISDDIDNVNQQKSQQIYTRISKGFRQQQEQAEIFKENIKQCKNPIIICGDMNNSPFSYVYRSIKGKLKDTFEEAGEGFGATYKFRYYPARIDYIFSDSKMKVKQFESFSDFENSDHYPIMTRLSME